MMRRSTDPSGGVFLMSPSLVRLVTGSVLIRATLIRASWAASSASLVMNLCIPIHLWPSSLKSWTNWMLSPLIFILPACLRTLLVVASSLDLLMFVECPINSSMSTTSSMAPLRSSSFSESKVRSSMNANVNTVGALSSSIRN